MKRVLAGLVVLLVAGGVWIKWQGEALPVPLIEVSVGAVEEIAANSRAGTVRACRRSGLSLIRGGRVAQLRVAEGDRVKAGQVLLQLHDQAEQIALIQARTEVRAAQLEKERSCFAADLASREWERSKKLADKQLLSAEKLDRVSTEFRVQALSCSVAANRVEQTRAIQEQRQVLLDEMQLLAPFSGIVAEINGELGEFTTPSPPGVATPPAVDLIDDSCLYVRVPIDEIEAAHLKIGQPARITLDAFRGRIFTGKLSRIAPYVSEQERQARTVDVDVTFDTVPEDVRLLVGYSADVEIIIQRYEDQLRVPTDTVLGGQYVLRYDPDTSTLNKVAITTAASNWNWTAVTAGLKTGDRILGRLDTAGAEEGAWVTAQ